MVARMTINQPEFQGDANLLGDRALGIWINEDSNYYFSTYNFRFNVGNDNVDRWTTIAYDKDETEWAWAYYGYDRELRQTVAYMRFADRETIEIQTEN